LKIYPPEHDRRCPDYCFYLAETLLVIDHQKRHTRIQVSLFTPMLTKNASEQRIETLQSN
jgi:anthranilate synthase component 1